MENKLSELSKPVAYDYQYAGVETCEGFGSWRNELTWDCPPDWMVETGKVKNLKPRYSQEYVSALLAELEASKKSSAFLKEQLAKLANFNPDWDMLEACRESWREVSAALKEAEKRLATPVRLKKVDSSNVPFAGDGFNAAVDYCAKAVRAAGFKCVGDE